MPDQQIPAADSSPDLAHYRLNRDVFGDPADTGSLPTWDAATALAADWVPNDRLRLHMYQVAALMRAWAQQAGAPPPEAQLWALAGLLHDADWERWPNEHCRRIVEHLEQERHDPRLIRAIACHSPRFFGVQPREPLELMIYAFDELSGFVHAVSLVRPEGYSGMTAKSVKKKLKEKSFAAQVDRSDIADGVARSGRSLDELIDFVIEHQHGVAL